MLSAIIGDSPDFGFEWNNIKTRNTVTMKMERIMKRIALVLALVLLVAAVTACGHEAQHETTETPTTKIPPEEELVPAAPASTDGSGPEESEPAPDGSGTGALNCLDGAGTVTALVSAPTGEAAARTERTEGNGHACFLYRIDPAMDTVLAKTEGEEDPGFPIGIRDNGEIVTFQNEKQRILRFDAALQPVGELPAEGSRAFYSPNEDVVYLIREGDLVRLSFDGAEQTLLRFHGQRYVDDVDLDAHAALVLDGPVSDLATEAYMVYSFEGEKRFSCEADHGPYLFSDGLLCAVDYEGVPADETGERGAMLMYDPQNGWSLRAEEISIRKAYTAIPGSPFLCCTELLDAGGGMEQTSVELLNVHTGEVFEYGTFDGSQTVAAACDRSDGTILLAVSSGAFLSFSKIDPKTLAVSDVLTQTQARPMPEPEAIQLPAHLSQARALADQIENRYHVRVLLGDEVRQARSSDYGYEYTSELESEEETRCVMRALDTLESALALYPEGFFDFFRNDDGEAGVRFLLVGALVDESSSFRAAGYTYPAGAWYNIAVTVDDLSQTVAHHEIWHAVEDLAGFEGRAVGYYDWMPLNPEGYEYVLDKETFEEAEYSEYLLGNPDHDKVYFYKPYSTVNDAEDRATVIEALFSFGSVSEGYAFVQQYPHLFAKVQYLGDLIRPVFGYVYWEEMIG